MSIQSVDLPKKRTRPLLTILSPYIPSSLAGLAALQLTSSGSDIDTFLKVNGVVILLMLGARQLVALLDNLQLSGTLAETVDELRKSQAELRYHANNDPLTQLFNRRYLDSYIDKSAAMKKRVAVMYMDLNDFKAVNDTFGHELGDWLLIETARRINACVRPDDVVVRLGGDEFAVVLEDAGDTYAVESIVTRLTESLHDSVTVDGRQMTLSASVGYAISYEGEPIGETLRRADVAMYYAKRKNSGGNARFHESMNA